MPVVLDTCTVAHFQLGVFLTVSFLGNGCGAGIIYSGMKIFWVHSTSDNDQLMFL